MKERYKIYISDYKGYSLLDVAYDKEDIQAIINSLDGNTYISYMVIKHDIKTNTEEVFDFGYTDYNVKRRRK